MKPKISIIAALDKKRGIGKKGKLPWYIPGELKRFKEITMGHPVIMGRKTHESIGQALPGRTNIVITHDQNYQAEGYLVAGSLEEALDKAQNALGNEEIFIIGGGQIYSLALPKTDKLYLTLIEDDFDADVFFPDYSDFKKVVFEQEQETEVLRYKFLELER